MLPTRRLKYALLIGSALSSFFPPEITILTFRSPLMCCVTLQMEDSGAVVKCCSLEGKFGRLDVIGCKAIQSLKRMLHPIIK
jgi:hypothetical protein